MADNLKVSDRVNSIRANCQDRFSGLPGRIHDAPTDEYHDQEGARPVGSVNIDSTENDGRDLMTMSHDEVFRHGTAL